MNARCNHNILHFLTILEDDGNLLKVLYKCKKCNHIFVHTIIKC